jgi:hypothetical protein
MSDIRILCNWKGVLEGARGPIDVIKTDIKEMWTGLEGRGNRGLEVHAQLYD